MTGLRQAVAAYLQRLAADARGLAERLDEIPAIDCLEIDADGRLWLRGQTVAFLAPGISLAARSALQDALERDTGLDAIASEQHELSMEIAELAGELASLPSEADVRGPIAHDRTRPAP